MSPETLKTFLELGELMHKGGAPLLYLTLIWLVVEQQRLGRAINELGMRLSWLESALKGRASPAELTHPGFSYKPSRRR